MIEQFLITELFTFLLVFVRIGTGIMLVPGFGESYVSPRFRLLLALAISLAMTPALAQYIPEVPTSPLTLAIYIAKEILVGLFFGFIMRILISAMHTTGMIISYQSSLAAATMFDVTQAGQGSGIGNFLSIVAVVLLFATDMHFLILQGLHDSYILFPVTQAVPVSDMAEVISRLVGDVFLVSVKLASPIIILGLVIYTGSGVLARLMPNMQVFFVIVPPQILLSFMMFSMILSGMLLWYLEFLEEHIITYVQ